jgi:hypothetical protein
LKREEPTQLRRSSWDDWVRNAGVELAWVGDQPACVPRQPLPVDASYLFSPFRGWFDYLSHELRQADQHLSAVLVDWIGRLCSLLGLRKTVVLGAEPVSTNLYGPSDTSSLLASARLASARYPQHYLAIRNLTREHHAELIDGLTSQGFVALPARVIYEFKAPAQSNFSEGLDGGAARRPSHLSRDLKLLTKSGLLVSRPVTVDAHQAERLRAWYERIYLKKHSQLNAQYTADFFLGVINEGLMELLVLEQQGEWLGFALIYRRGNVATVPALGYSELCEPLGGYRLVFAAIYRQTVGLGLLLNYSSGAGDFKRKRGGVPLMEFTLLKAPKRSHWRKSGLAWIGRRLSHLSLQDLISRGA